MPAIRHQINIAAPIRTVWRALTTEAGLTSWWVDEARLVAEKGGRVVLRSEGDEEGEMVEEVGIFLELRPTRRIEIKWDSTSPAATKGTRVQFTVARDGDETRVSVVHSGKGILDDEEAWPDMNKGWRSAMRALRGSLED